MPMLMLLYIEKRGDSAVQLTLGISYAEIGRLFKWSYSNQQALSKQRVVTSQRNSEGERDLIRRKFSIAE